MGATENTTQLDLAGGPGGFGGYPPPGGGGPYGPPPGGYGAPPPGGYGGPPGGLPPNPYAPPGAPPPIGYGYGGGPVDCPLAGEALKYALVGLLCCGIILGPLAIKKGLDAKKMIAMTPGMTGEGKATAAIIVGILDVVFSLVGLAARTASMSQPSVPTYNFNPN